MRAWLVLGLCAAAVLGCLLRLSLTHNLDESVILDLVVVASGALVTSRLRLGALLAAAVAGWVAVVAAGHPFADPVPHAAVWVGCAVALAVVLHEARRGAESRLRSAHDALATTADRFRSVFDGSPVGVGLADAEGRYVAVNAAFVAIMGRPAEELVGHTSLGYTHPDDIEAHEVATRRWAQAPEGRWRLEKRCVRPDGTVRWVAMDCALLRGTHGQQGWQVVHVQDITERKQAQAQEERLRSLLASAERLAGMGSWEWEPSTGSIVWSDEMFRLVGRAAGVAPPLAEFLAVVHPDDREQVRTAFREGLRRRVGSRLQYRLQVNGETRYVEGISQVHCDQDGEVTVLRGSVQDITERVLAEDAMRERHADLVAIARVVRQIHSGADPRSSIIAGAQDIVGVRDVVLLESDGEGLVVTAAEPMDHVGTRIALDRPTRTAQVWRSGEQIFLPDAAGVAGVSQRLLDIVGAHSVMWQPIVAPDGSGSLGLLIMTWPDRFDALDERQRAAATLLADEAAIALQRQQLLTTLTVEASTDSLTGLPNRRTWEEILPRALEEARVTKRPVTVALADLDHFKVYNDRHGHAGGDQLLRAFATAGRAALRERDVLARWGGEEFALVLPDCDGPAATAVLERLRAAVPEDVTCSVGSAVWDGEESAQALLARADAALYRAKASGRDRLVSSEDAAVDPAVAAAAAVAPTVASAPAGG